MFRPGIAKKVTRLLLKIHALAYRYLGPFAVASEGGLHPKHRLMNYHKFFVDNLHQGSSVLDVGCGNGALLKDIAEKTGVAAVGIEMSERNVASARARLSAYPSVEIICADIWEYKAKGKFDAIVLSNVLEHLDNRSELLKRLNDLFGPEQILIRVPMFEREWVVPYKKEFGIEWRLDDTHKIEYTYDELHRELRDGGLEIKDIKFNWGEIWAVAVPSGKAIRLE